MSNLIEHLQQAQNAALARGIEANAVVINDKLIFSKFKTTFGSDIPVICGLKCVYTEELPEDISFVVCRAENIPLTKDDQIQKLKEENLILQEKLNKIFDLIEEVV